MTFDSPSIPFPLTRPAIALRWWVDRAGRVHPHWPRPELADGVTAMGWVNADQASGVIVHVAGVVTPRLLDALEVRFPGRRWFEQRWGAETSRARRAA